MLHSWEGLGFCLFGFMLFHTQRPWLNSGLSELALETAEALLILKAVQIIRILDRLKNPKHLVYKIKCVSKSLR